MRNYCAFSKSPSHFISVTCDVVKAHIGASIVPTRRSTFAAERLSLGREREACIDHRMRQTARMLRSALRTVCLDSWNSLYNKFRLHCIDCSVCPAANWTGLYNSTNFYHYFCYNNYHDAFQATAWKISIPEKKNTKWRVRLSLRPCTFLVLVGSHLCGRKATKEDLLYQRIYGFLCNLA